MAHGNIQCQNQPGSLAGNLLRCPEEVSAGGGARTQGGAPQCLGERGLGADADGGEAAPWRVRPGDGIPEKI